MFVLFSKLDTNNGFEEFELSDLNHLPNKNFSLLEKSYLYIMYYNKIITDMSDSDLDNFELFDAPFNRAVFIIKKDKKSNELYKLNCVTSPPSYYLSTFDPTSGTSEIISDKARDVFTFLKDKLFLLNWEQYSKLFYFISRESSEEDYSAGLQLEGFSSGGLRFDSNVQEEKKILDTGFQFQSSSISIQEPEDIGKNKFDKMPIKQRKLRIEKLKADLINAKKVRNLKKSLADINKQIKNLKSLQFTISQKNKDILKKEENRVSFEDISWMDDNLYEKLVLYLSKSKEHDSELEHLNNKLIRVDEKVEKLGTNSILTHKVFMPTMLLGIIFYLLSWILRDQLWFLSAGAIISFTAAFYYFWEYSDHLDYVLGLKREKRFFIRKVEKEENRFRKLFGALELTLKKERVTDINGAIFRYDELQKFEKDIKDMQIEIVEFKKKYFSEKEENLLVSLESQKIDSEKELAKFDSVEFFVEEIENNISLLKASVKNYEKQELDAFSLDDEPEEKLKDELTFSTKQAKKFDFTYSLEFLFDYLNDYLELFKVDSRTLYQAIEKYFLDIVEFSIHHEHLIKFDIENKKFTFQSEVELEEWETDYKIRFQFFLQFALFRHSLEKPNPIFIDLEQLKSIHINLSPYLKEIENSQIIYK